jgi:hypothetical protein
MPLAIIRKCKTSLRTSRHSYDAANSYIDCRSLPESVTGANFCLGAIDSTALIVVLKTHNPKVVSSSPTTMGFSRTALGDCLKN